MTTKKTETIVFGKANKNLQIKLTSVAAACAIGDFEKALEELKKQDLLAEIPYIGAPEQVVDKESKALVSTLFYDLIYVNHDLFFSIIKKIHEHYASVIFAHDNVDKIKNIHAIAVELQFLIDGIEGRAKNYGLDFSQTKYNGFLPFREELAKLCREIEMFLWMNNAENKEKSQRTSTKTRSKQKPITTEYLDRKPIQQEIEQEDLNTARKVNVILEKELAKFVDLIKAESQLEPVGDMRKKIASVVDTCEILLQHINVQLRDGFDKKSRGDIALRDVQKKIIVAITFVKQPPLSELMPQLFARLHLGNEPITEKALLSSINQYIKILMDKTDKKGTGAFFAVPPAENRRNLLCALQVELNRAIFLSVVFKNHSLAQELLDIQVKLNHSIREKFPLVSQITEKKASEPAQPAEESLPTVASITEPVDLAGKLV